MSTERICAIYSRGPHFVRLLRCLRENYPEAALVAAIPMDFPFEVIEGLADETIRLPEAKDTRGLRGGRAALQSLRQANCTHVVVMFDSPRLNLLTALSQIPNRRCFTVDGRFYRLDRGPLALVLEVLRQRVRGQWHYMRAWWGTRRIS